MGHRSGQPCHGAKNRIPAELFARVFVSQSGRMHGGILMQVALLQLRRIGAVRPEARSTVVVEAQADGGRSVAALPQ